MFQGVLKVYTSDIRQCTDYKTIRVSTKTTARNVIEMVLTKFKLTCRDPNLFELWMELTTKAEGKPVKTILRLENDAKPLELQRCHPAGMSRFLLHMNATGTLVRVYDHNICAASNYKSLMLSSLTNCEEAIDLILAQNRKSREESANYGLFLTTPEAEAQIPPEVSIVSVYVLSQPQHKIVIRPLDSL
ncbi:hypothetical protein WR25_06743 [Diploscapter pachys]|uniref:Ras-associating domain-containing protein n=1 Tax=Diploscapter pachys TaxID=2018661 RepID=A0A2A2LXM0_9BILA|nr:hypothetical protein WR25_06743 [Diploscapter pachys]